MSSGGCNEFQRELSAYLDDEVTPARRVAITAHLASCAACGQRLAGLRELAAAVAAQPRAQPAADLLVGVRERLQRSEHRPWWQTLFRPFWFKVPLEVTAVIAVALFAAFFLRSPRPPPAGDEDTFAYKARIAEPVAEAEETPARSAYFEQLERDEAQPAPVPLTTALGELRSAPAPATSRPGPVAAPDGTARLAKLKDESTAAAGTAPVTLELGLVEEKRAEPAPAKRSVVAQVQTKALAARKSASDVADSGSRQEQDRLGSVATAAPAAGLPAAVVGLAAASEAEGRRLVAAVANELGGRLVAPEATRDARLSKDLIGVVWVDLPADQVAAFQARLVGPTGRDNRPEMLSLVVQSDRETARTTTDGGALAGSLIAGKAGKAEERQAGGARVLVAVELRQSVK
ncbi:zf-HC2 domain-containing protein [bacterium]|nr:zf-HC2 domain-containing protein [bacterium]